MIGAKMIEYYKGYRIPIYPSDTQAKFIDRCIELSRYVYNWAIDIEEENYNLYKEGKTRYSTICNYKMDKLFTELRVKKPWLKDVPHNSARNAIRHCTTAYKKFFDNKDNNTRSDIFMTRRIFQEFSSSNSLSNSFELEVISFLYGSNFFISKSFEICSCSSSSCCYFRR